MEQLGRCPAHDVEVSWNCPAPRPKTDGEKDGAGDTSFQGREAELRTAHGYPCRHTIRRMAEKVRWRQNLVLWNHGETGRPT
jgi:hypothetical protein